MDDTQIDELVTTVQRLRVENESLRIQVVTARAALSDMRQLLDLLVEPAALEDTARLDWWDQNGWTARIYPCGWRLVIAAETRRADGCRMRPEVEAPTFRQAIDRARGK